MESSGAGSSGRPAAEATQGERPPTVYPARALLAAATLVLVVLFHADIQAGESDAALLSDAMVGARIYRSGLGPSGGPIRATVMGDVTGEGERFACVHCHRRSGFGASEGNRGGLPVTGQTLFRSRTSGYRPRPAYTDETLARAIRTGIDAGGLPLDPLMPRYELPAADMTALIAYLKSLSSEISPGVSDTTVHWGTVITEEVDPDKQQAMLDVLDTFVRDKNGVTRLETRRSAHGPFYRDFMQKAYRKWHLHRWVLRGEPETWPAQLSAYYRQQPVFALLSGISTADWQPIHTFCETQQIPCLLPNTDLPGSMDESDFYTLYFSHGLTLEARAIAEDAARRFPGAVISQVFRPDTAGAVAARALRRAVEAREGISAVDAPLHSDDLPTPEALPADAAVLVLWLGAADLHQFQELSGRRRIYLSSTLLDGEPGVVPAGLRPITLLAHPYPLPQDLQKRFRQVSSWLKSRSVDSRHARIQAQTYFACRLAAEGLTHIRQFYYRDYFMDVFDHADGMSRFSVFYPRLSFGPGQRYLAKGSYILELAGEGEEAEIRSASWTVP
jgi:hypothetical protein